MRNEYDDLKQGSQQLLLGIWVIGDNPNDEEIGEKGIIESVFEVIEGEMNELAIDGLSKGVWIIKCDENNRLVIKIKNKLKSIFHDS